MTSQVIYPHSVNERGIRSCPLETSSKGKGGTNCDGLFGLWLVSGRNEPSRSLFNVGGASCSNGLLFCSHLAPDIENPILT